MNLYVTEQGAEVGLKRARIEVRKFGKVIGSERLEQLEQLVLFGHIQVTKQALDALMKHDIGVCFLSMSGRFRGRLVGPAGFDASIRHRQYAALSDNGYALSFAKACVAGKLHNQRAVLSRYQRRRQSDSLAKALLSIRLMQERVPGAESLASLRGIEGNAAAAYFGVFGELLSARGITFTKRMRRPPPDPVNIILSLGYTLLGHLVQGYTEVAKLDPHFGALHELEYSRPSLALDLLEEWRPILIDAAVLRAFNRRQLQKQHFLPTEAAEEEEGEEEESAPFVVLTPEGSKRWFALYESILQERRFYVPRDGMLTFRQIIREQVYRFSRSLRGIDVYQPFLIDN
jgi:CRISPR-associated protein Cas1